MNNKRYKLNLNMDIEQNWLEGNNFFWSDVHNLYIHRFNVWKISETSKVYCEVRLNINTKECSVDVYENPKTFYGPFYCSIWNIEAIDEIEIINKRIKDEFYRIGIVEDPDRCLPIPELHHMGRKGEYDDQS